MEEKENRWTEESSKRWRKPKGEDRVEMKKRGKNAEMHLAEWVSMEHREEEHEKLQGKV